MLAALAAAAAAAVAARRSRDGQPAPAGVPPAGNDSRAVGPADAGSAAGPAPEPASAAEPDTDTDLDGAAALIARVLGEALGRPAGSPPSPVPAPELYQVMRDALGDDAVAGIRLAPLPASTTALGQVHRATRPDGGDLLVEVQRPADVDRFDEACADPAAVAAAAEEMGVSAERAASLLIEWRKHLIDLRSGAHDQALVADLLRGHPHHTVAQPVPELSTASVRSVSDPGGLLLGEARTRSPEQRAEWAESFHRFAFAALRRHGLALTGLDPALVRFLPDGGVGVIRLGAVEHVAPEGLEAYDALVRAAYEHDATALDEAVQALGGDVPDQWHRPIADEAMPPTPVDPAGPRLVEAAEPIDRLHRIVGAVLDGLGGSPPVRQLVAELWRGAEPVSDLGRADRSWWQERTPLALIGEDPDGLGASPPADTPEVD